MQNSNPDAQKLSAARRVVRAELNSYDLLSKKAKIRFEHHVTEAVNANVYGPDKGYVCGHNISLCEPCDKCTRTEQDCREYQIALQTKLRKLLSQLKA